jgi:hypothetical protein
MHLNLSQKIDAFPKVLQEDYRRKVRFAADCLGGL